MRYQKHYPKQGMNDIFLYFSLSTLSLCAGTRHTDRQAIPTQGNPRWQSSWQDTCLQPAYNQQILINTKLFLMQNINNRELISWSWTGWKNKLCCWLSQMIMITCLFSKTIAILCLNV